ncbi:MAG: phage portal protein [Selenomonadales bacterium]|nr:phage portal protein [Selenomonadales bacterium]
MIEKFKNLFNAKTETRAIETTSDLESEMKSGYSTDSISRANALNIPAVGTAVNFITSTIAGLPVKLYKRNGDSITEIENDYRLNLLNRDTGDLLDAFQLKSALLTDMLLFGAGYALIEKQANEITGIFYVDHSYVAVTEGVDKIHKSAQIRLNGVVYPDTDIFRITRDSSNGANGIGILKQNSLLLNTMLSSLKYENSAVRNGAKRGFLKTSNKVSNEILKSIRKAWKKMQSTEDEGEIVVLNEGLDFVPAQATASENQLNESKKINSELIYNLFGLTTNLFNASTANADIYINAIKTGILPIVSAFNNALNKFLLLEKEKQDFYFAIDANELLKSTVSERYASYDTAIKTGWLQVDEVRKIEKLPPLGLNYVKLTQSDVLLDPATNQIFIANNASKIDLNSTATQGAGGGVNVE